MVVLILGYALQVLSINCLHYLFFFGLQSWSNAPRHSKSTCLGQVLIPSPMFLFCFAHGKFTLTSHNSALYALVSLIQNLVELF